MSNKLYYGNNLDVVRAYVASEGIDLVCPDPPFHSQVHYNILFKSPSGGQSDAQIKAFADTGKQGRLL
ncbi:MULTISPECIES: hypothetical protein [Sphingobium]|uniref:DNA methylase N-4/N-6 domain-containing protein n=2 Tax=Sphingobium cupriresistens TaxID=1132417 RepID=A0A0J7XWG4_9SPHN|nr:MULTISPECIES: hypothetical protein [Sphingobium]KMS55922.1 hypothetical protein V473_12585 [Sphingobium cupriresistens LL01]MBJ7378962.1 hypothetical protein [Sphingobium sp.]RYM07374.1 hypothetical protein EWH12_19155 [Sphingobium cupriresistens]WCP12539.1 hypothetical protein sphantq_00939 [Sphingobium sp. AntQ-1]